MHLRESIVTVLLSFKVNHSYDNTPMTNICTSLFRLQNYAIECKPTRPSSVGQDSAMNAVAHMITDENPAFIVLAAVVFGIQDTSSSLVCLPRNPGRHCNVVVHRRVNILSTKRTLTAQWLPRLNATVVRVSRTAVLCQHKRGDN